MIPKLNIHRVKSYLLQQRNYFCERSSLSSEGKRGESYDRKENVGARRSPGETPPVCFPRRGYRGGHVAVLLRPLSVAICHSDVCKHARSWLASRYVRSNHVRRRKMHSSTWQGLPREILDQTTAWCALSPVRYPSRRARNKNVPRYWRW